MAAEVLHPLAGHGPKTSQSLASRQLAHRHYQQQQQQQHRLADHQTFYSSRQGKDILSTILSDYGSMPSSEVSTACASDMPTAVSATNLLPSFQFGPAAPSPRLELSSSLKLGELMGFPFYEDSTSPRTKHGESNRVEQKALDDPSSITPPFNTEATFKTSTSFQFPSPPTLTGKKSKNNNHQSKHGQPAKVDGEITLSTISSTTKLARTDSSNQDSAIASSLSARPASQGSLSKKFTERPLPALPPKPFLAGELGSSPKTIEFAETRVTAARSATSIPAITPLASSIGDFDLDAFPKPYHARKNSAVTGPPLTALRRNKLSVSDTNTPPIHVRSASSADQIRPRTSSLPSAANQQKHTKHIRSSTETETTTEAKPLLEPGMGNKASRAAVGASTDNNVPSLPKAVFRRKPVQTDQPSNLKNSTSATTTANSSYVEASASGRTDSRTSTLNKALPKPTTPSIISVQTSHSKIQTASDEKAGQRDGEAVTTDMITDAFPSPPKSRSSPDSTPQLLPPPSPVPEDSPSKYGLNKVGGIGTKENEAEIGRKDDPTGKANMHIRGKSSTGLDIFRAAAAMTSSTKLSSLVGKGGHGLPANPRSRLDSIPQGLATNPKTLQSNPPGKEVFRPGPPLQLINTNTAVSKGTDNNPSPSISHPNSATDSEPSSSSQPNSATSSNKTFSSSTSTATCSTLTSPTAAGAIPATKDNKFSTYDVPSAKLQEQQPTTPNDLTAPHPPQHIAPLQKTHLNCYQNHTRFHLSHNSAAPMPCMSCFADNVEDRWTCVWCALRICAGCKARLEKVPGRKVEVALTRLPGLDRAVAMGIVGGFGSGGKLGDWRMRR